MPIAYSKVAHEIIWSPIIIAGRIPLRQLVYRVLDLPTSMRPLVYDFGQLNTQTEEDYTNQIVLDHVRIHICNSDMFLWSHVICVILSCHVMSCHVTCWVKTQHVQNFMKICRQNNRIQTRTCEIVFFKNVYKAVHNNVFSYFTDLPVSSSLYPLYSSRAGIYNSVWYSATPL